MSKHRRKKKENDEDEDLPSFVDDRDPTLLNLSRRFRRFGLDGKLEEMKQMLADGMDVNCEVTLNGSPLMDAIHHDNRIIFDYLLTVPGININKCTYKGFTALTWSLKKKRYYMLEKLLSHPDLKVDTKDWEDRTPYELSVMMNIRKKYQLEILSLQIPPDSEMWRTVAPIPETRKKVDLTHNSLLNICRKNKHLEEKLVHKTRGEVFDELMNNNYSDDTLLMFFFMHSFATFAEFGINRKTSMDTLSKEFRESFQKLPLSASKGKIIQNLMQGTSQLKSRARISEREAAAPRKQMLSIESEALNEIFLGKSDEEKDRLFEVLNFDFDELLKVSGAQSFFNSFVGVPFPFEPPVNAQSEEEVEVALEKSFRILRKFCKISDETLLDAVNKMAEKKDPHSLCRLYFVLNPSEVRRRVLPPLEPLLAACIMHRDDIQMDTVVRWCPYMKSGILDAFVELILSESSTPLLLQERKNKRDSESEEEEDKEEEIEGKEEKEEDASEEEEEERPPSTIDFKALKRNEELMKRWNVPISDNLKRKISHATELTVLAEMLAMEKYPAALEYSEGKKHLRERVEKELKFRNIPIESLPKFSERKGKALEDQLELILRKLHKKKGIIHLTHANGEPVRAVQMPESLKSNVFFVNNKETIQEMWKHVAHLVSEGSCPIHKGSAETVSKGFNRACICPPIGLDMEWRTPRPVSLIQISTSDRVYLIDTIPCTPSVGIDENTEDPEYAEALGDCLLWMFTEKHLLKVGFSFHSDLKQVHKIFPKLIAQNLANFIDLQPLAVKVLGKKEEIVPVKEEKKGKKKEVKGKVIEKVEEKKAGLPLYSLAKLTFEMTGQILDKTQQSSNWDRRPLGDAQRDYAALDAYILVDLMRLMQKKLGDMEDKQLQDNGSV